MLINHLEALQDVRALYRIMKDLRPHLKSENEFVDRVQRQMEGGYRLLCAWTDERIAGLAGYRLQENLLYGRYLYVDDLMILKKYRQRGIGTQLIDATRTCAEQHGCKYLVLDTGIYMRVAHQFYFQQGFNAHAVHFTQRLERNSETTSH